MAEGAARIADGRGVDDRGEFLDVIDEQPVEEGFVAHVQRGQADVFFQVVGLAPDVLKFEFHLLLDREDPPGQQPAQAGILPLRAGERRALVQHRIFEDLSTAHQPCARNSGRRAAAGRRLAAALARRRSGLPSAG